MPVRTSRKQADLWRDNLWLAVAHSQRPLGDLQEVVARWVRDAFPAAAKRPLALHVANRDELHTFLDDHPYSRLHLAERLVAPTGLYGPIGRFAAGHGRIYLDSSSASRGIHRARKERTPDGNEKFVRVEGEGLFSLHAVIADDSKRSLDTLATRIEEVEAIEFFYVCTIGPDTWKHFARFGGTGRLEAYAADSRVRSHVHKRNLATAESCDEGYSVYVRGYVNKISRIDPKAANAEALLRAEDPPDDPFHFPSPPGATDSELAELAAAAPTTSLQAWEAIRDKLDAIYGEKRGQMAWFKADVTIETGDALKVGEGLTKVGVNGKIKLGFTADSSGEIKQATERELEVSGLFTNAVIDTDKGELKEIEQKPEVGADEELGIGGASVGVKFNGDQVMTEVHVKVGPYGIKFDNKGKVTIETLFVDVSGNVHTGHVVISKEHSFKDAIKDRIKQAHDGALPPWFERMPDVKFKWELGTQIGHDASDIMRVVGKYPGLWEMRARGEFEKLHWNSLDSEERTYLGALGFDQRRWDYMALPDACKDSWWKLSAAQKDASLRLPVSSGDPYWEEYWTKREKERAPTGDVRIAVHDGEDAPIGGALVKLARDEGHEQELTTDTKGLAEFKAISAGVYELEVQGTSGGKPFDVGKVTLKRGTLLERKVVLS